MPVPAGKPNTTGIPSAFRLLSACASLIAAAGCSTYESRSHGMATAFAKGNFAVAAHAAAAMEANSPQSRDYLIWRLEEGTARRAAGDIRGSIAAFNQAEEAMLRHQAGAAIRIGAELAALFSNQDILPYTGRAYDGIMLNTYQALNHLALGDPAGARVHLVRAEEQQKYAVHDNRRRIAETEQAMQKHADAQVINESLNHPRFREQLAGAYASLEKLPAYADYVNPFTVWLDGIFFLRRGKDAADLDRARLSLRRAAGLAPGNNFVAADLQSAESASHETRQNGLVYVVFETGLGPARQESRFDLPLIFANLSYIGITLPTLVFNHDYAPHLEARAGGSTWTTAPIASVDAIVANDFKNELPLIVSRTVAATLAKAAATYAVNRKMEKQGETTEILSRILTAIFQISVNVADLRAWRTLPKQFHICRLPLPADRQVELCVPGGQSFSLTMEHGSVFLVSVRSVCPHTRPSISVMVLD